MARLIRGALVALPLLLALALALAGCGSGDDGGDVASAGGKKTPGASASAGSTLSADERALKYAQCMREHGVDMDDPEPGQKGVRFTAGPGTDQSTVDKAMEACRKYSPQANQSPGQAKKQLENARKFAACMRKNGVEEFPDPSPDQPGVRVDKKIADDPDFESAQKACQDILSGGSQGGK